VDERGIARGVIQAALRGFKCSGSYVGGQNAGPDQVDDILPFPQTRKPAEPGVAHAGLLFAANAANLSNCFYQMRRAERNSLRGGK
jgi:hypothetical protein